MCKSAVEMDQFFFIKLQYLHELILHHLLSFLQVTLYIKQQSQFKYNIFTGHFVHSEDGHAHRSISRINRWTLVLRGCRANRLGGGPTFPPQLLRDYESVPSSGPEHRPHRHDDRFSLRQADRLRPGLGEGRSGKVPLQVGSTCLHNCLIFFLENLYDTIGFDTSVLS